MDYILPDSIFESHDSYVSEVCRIYEKDNRSWYENLLWKHVGIESLLNGSFTDFILSREFSIRLFSDRIILPENLVLHTRNSTSLVLKDISAILALVSLFSSHESISLDTTTWTFLTSFLVTFIHSCKSKGVFGFTIPNTPYFSHTLFSIMPKNLNPEFGIEIFSHELLCRFPFCLRLYKIQLFHKIRSRIRKNNSYILHKSFFIVYKSIKQCLIVCVQNLIGRDEFSKEDKICLSVRIFLFFCEIICNKILSFIIIEILIRCSQRSFNGFYGCIGSSYSPLEFGYLSGKNT